MVMKSREKDDYLEVFVTCDKRQTWEEEDVMDDFWERLS
jgi:hypothetical protein